MKPLKTLIPILAAAVVTACGTGTPEWTSLMPDAEMSNWRTVDGNPHPETTPEEIVIANDKVMIYGPADTEAALPGFRNFVFSARVSTSEGAASSMWFHHGDGYGYEIALGNKRLDAGRLKRGSLVNVRNIYKSMAPDGEWFDLTVTVKGKQIAVELDGVLLVDYVEPAEPFRLTGGMGRLGAGTFVFDSYEGTTRLRDVKMQALADDATGRTDAADETADPVMDLTQRGFPVIDNHVHLKGWNLAQAMENSRRTGIFYAIAPNCGIGFPITDDAGIDAYIDTTRNVAAFRAMQGEGREWPATFSEASRRKFDFVFTDAMTFIDHAGRRTRLWIDDEVVIDIPVERYMDQIVDRAVGVVSDEPLDVYVNPFFLPTAMRGDFETLWTDERVARVVEALAARGVALEVNAYYRIPGARIIRAAMDAGVKLSFGTNNYDANIGTLEYCIEMVRELGITPEHMFFPENM
ncbi:MAG: DUF1080 domain-containing protein [Alistipes sp.]|jgi:hypothetical protein|nr:DUF1080 domain-containing protein [Alistipes sp.]